MKIFNIIIWIIMLWVTFDMFKTSIHYYLHQSHHSSNRFISNLSYLHMYRHRYITPNLLVIPSYLHHVLIYDIILKNILLQIPLYCSINNQNSEFVLSIKLLILIEWIITMYDFFTLKNLANKEKLNNPLNKNYLSSHYADHTKNLSIINYKKAIAMII